MTHWASSLIGIPWCFGAQGPDAFDCWNFVRMVQREHYDRTMPEIPNLDDWRVAAAHLAAHPERERWTKVESPEDGDVVMMARSKLPVHIGIWIRANRKEGVLHCLEGIGVVFQERAGLGSHGWGHLDFYRYKTS